MTKSIKTHFPDSKAKWKTYLKVFLPIIAGSIMFALNGVVDNFMVGHITQGQAALGAINSWTSILIGFFLGTAATGSVIMAQYYHAGKHDMVMQISRIRFLLSITVALAFAAVAWGNPEILAEVFLKKGKNIDQYNIALDNAVRYARIMGIQWVLITFAFNYGNQLRELGHGRVTMFWGIGTLGTNIILNSVFMYALHMGVEGAAWASVAGRTVAFTIGVIYTYKNKMPILINPFMLFKISKKAWKIYLRRGIYGLSIFTVTFFVIFRSYFYSAGYPDGSLGKNVSGMSVVSLTGSIMNVFTVVFNGLAAMAAVFVGSELGKGNLKQARINSNQLKGFNTLIASVFGLLLAGLASIVPFMKFLSEAPGTENAVQLSQVSHSLFVIAIFLPIWIWFTTSYRNASTGGKGHWFSIVDWIVSGPIQLAWLALIMFGIVPNSGPMQDQFAFSYALFFLSDLLKLVIFEILYYKYPWENSITTEQAETEIAAAQDAVDVENLHD